LLYQEGLITNSAWKDYSSASGTTNYAYEHFDPNSSPDVPDGAGAGRGKRGGGGVNGATNGRGPSSGGVRGGPPGSQARNGSGYAVPYGDSRSLQRPPKNGTAGGHKGAMMVSSLLIF
jgi:hypothetical protein